MDTDFKGCPLWKSASRVCSTAGIGAFSWRIHPGGKTSISNCGAAVLMSTSLYFHSLCYPQFCNQHQRWMPGCRMWEC